MAGQPANTDIKVYRALRTYRQAHRHESVGALIKRLRPQVLSVPGEEVLVGALTRDTNTADFSPYMGEARHNAGRGFPIVVGLLGQVSASNAATNLPDIDFPFQIGENTFITNTEAGLTGDLHQDARDLAADL